MSRLLKGKAVADKITDELTIKTEFLKKEDILPCLGIIRVGERPDDLAYERGAAKRAEKIGIKVNSYILPENANEEELTRMIEEVNSDEKVHGVLIFRPLPAGIDEMRVIEQLRPEKDIDGITSGSMSAIYEAAADYFAPCTAEACIELLDHYDISLTGKNVTVIGRSLVIGKPVTMLLMKRDATVTICHSKTENLKGITKRADIVIAASGRAKMINGDYLCDGQVVLDVGINVDDKGDLCGDVDIEDAETLDILITPVPGGIGSVTSSVLCKHVVEAAAKSKNKKRQ